MFAMVRRLFVIKTPVEAYMIIYALALGAVERGIDIKIVADAAMLGGADGIVPGLANVDPRGYVRLYDAAQRGERAGPQRARGAPGEAGQLRRRATRAARGARAGARAAFRCCGALARSRRRRRKCRVSRWIFSICPRPPPHSGLSRAMPPCVCCRTSRPWCRSCPVLVKGSILMAFWKHWAMPVAHRPACSGRAKMPMRWQNSARRLPRLPKPCRPCRQVQA